MKKRGVVLRSRAIPPWLAMPIMTLVVLGLVAFALTRRDPNRWPELVYPAILGGALVLGMAYWLLRLGRVEKALRTTEQKYHGIYDNSIEGIFQSTPEGRFISANPALARMFGYDSPEELLASATDLDHQFYVSPTRRDEFTGILNEHGVVSDFESEIRCKDGSTIWISENARAVRDPRGKTLYYEGTLVEVTARRAAEEALRKERNLLRTLIDNLPDRIFIKDTNGRRILANSADWQAAGVARVEDIIGKSVFELFPPELATRYSEDDQEVLQTGQPILNREEPAVDQEGKPLWTLATEVPLRDTHQNLIGIVGIIRDITAYKRSVEAQRAAEERYRQIFEESVEGIYQSTPDGAFITVNPAMAHIFGYAAPDEMIALVNDLERQFYVEPSRRGEFKRMIETTGKIAGFESEVYRKDGGTLWISEHGRVVRNVDGGISYYEGTIVDITERKRAEAAQRTAEAALRESEERFSSAFAYAAIGMALVAPDGRWVKVNRALCDLVGYPDTELLGMTFQDITHPDDLELDLHFVRQMLAGEIQTYKMEKRYFHKSGRIVWILLSVSLVRGADGTPHYFVSQIQDISDRKQAELTQQETQRKQEVWISELEQRTRDITLLNEMSDLIQCCPTVEEAYRVVEQQVQWLFPHDSGALYVLNSSRNLVESKAAWGAPFTDPPTFPPSDCWAFRRGQLHGLESIWADDPDINRPLLYCNHIQPPMPEAYLCVPLIAQGESLGMLHLRHSVQAGPNTAAPHGAWYPEARRQLGRTVADSLALSISNLNLKESLRQQSIRDPLTGLFNRRYLEESLDREVARASRAERPVGIIMADIDHFKRFNDTFGHPAGDAVLRELGALLRSQVREADIACRYGGEEFALIMPDASLEITKQRAEMICKAVRSLEVQQGGRLLDRITVSLGVADFPCHGRSGEAVIRRADEALYQAKQCGRDQVRTADSAEGGLNVSRP